MIGVNVAEVRGPTILGPSVLPLAQRTCFLDIES